MNDKITVVIVSRDDNYGGNLQRNAIVCLRNMINVMDEVIYVDWKPFNNVSLIDSIRDYLPKTGKLKHIKVEREHIEEYIPECIDYPIVEVVGRNVGIRHATGDWIISTNIDIICYRPNVKKYNKDCFYVGRRRDVRIGDNWTVPDIEHYVRNLSANDYPQKQYSVIDGKPVWDKDDIWSLVVCCGDFQIAHKTLWNGIKGFEESLTGRCAADGNVMKKANISGFMTGVDNEVLIYHLLHEENVVDREPGEYLPKNNMWESLAGWNTPTNKADWGMGDIDFFEEII